MFTELTPAITPSRRFRNFIFIVVANIIFLAVSFAYLEINPLMFFTEFHYVADLINEMLPPAWSLYWTNPGIWSSVGVTFAMAFIGTSVGAVLAFLLALLAARNICPAPWIRTPTRILLGAQRAAPDFAIMLVIVVAVGFGPFAGTLALIIGSTGMFGKLFSDAIEHVDPDSLESLRSLGASRMQVIRYGILPYVLPSIVANTLYLFEINLGGAIALGVFGGGGLGFELHLANSSLNYPAMLAYISLIVMFLIVTEKVSDRIRSRILAAGNVLQ